MPKKVKSLPIRLLSFRVKDFELGSWGRVV